VIERLGSLPRLSTDARAVVNGLFGDALAAQESALAIPTTFRTSAGDQIPLDRRGVRQSLPGAGARVWVLVHGVM
jgi:hypothetical protein